MKGTAVHREKVHWISQGRNWGLAEVFFFLAKRPGHHNSLVLTVLGRAKGHMYEIDSRTYQILTSQ